MPSQTFMSLPQEKQDRIINISIQEFSRHRFDEVSINEIIKQAGISRGSFYQYFTDKSDLFLYLSQNRQKDLLKLWREKLKKNNGDLFAAYLEYANILIDYQVPIEEQMFNQNMFMFVDNLHSNVWNRKDPKPEMKDFKHAHHEDLKEQFGLDLVDRSKLRVHDDEELYFLFRIIIGLLIQIFRRKLSDSENFSKPVFQKRVNILIDWLKNGALKEELDD